MGWEGLLFTDSGGYQVFSLKDFLAEGQGFEPWEALTSLVFKTSAFDHSATPPEGSSPRR